MSQNWWESAPVVSASSQDANWWDNAEVVSEGGPQSDRAQRRGREVRDVRGLQVLSPIGGLAAGIDMHLGRFMGRGQDQENRVTSNTLNRLPEPVANVARGLGTGIPKGFTFAFDDELSGLLGGDEAKDASRAAQQINMAETPVSNFAGEVIGGIASPVSKPIAAATGARSGMNMSQAAMAGARGGFLGGGLYGAGDAEGGLGERIDGATGGALLGTAAGAILGPAIQPVINKVQTGQFFPRSGGATVLDTAREQLGVPNSAIAGLRRVLTKSGYSGDDIDGGIVSIADRLQAGSETGDRAGLFALELQKEFPAAQQNIQDVFQQLMTAPPTQGRTGRILTQALDDQYDSQGSYLQGVSQQKLGTATIADEQAALARQRGDIGAQRERSLKYAETDARNRRPRDAMRLWYEDYSTGEGADREIMGTMRAAARELGFSGQNEAADAMAKNPVALLNKFQELSFAKSKTPSGASPVLMQARTEAQQLLDHVSRMGREADNFAFAKRADGDTGPFKQRQEDFRQNYSQEEAITEARGRFGKVRDPVEADEFISWYENLPAQEKNLAKTVVRQDMERMLRGGNIDQDGAYLANLKKVGVSDVLVKMFGKEGEDITRAIGRLVDEQKGLVALDPRKGLQNRVVRGGAAQKARNLYTTHPLARLGDKIPNMSQFADFALMGAGQLPVLTMTKQGSRVFRPNAKTREGIAQILAMRQIPRTPSPRQAAPPTAIGAAAGQAGGQQNRPALPAPEWQGVRLPQAPAPAVARVQTGAQQKADAAMQKQQRAQQAIADARAIAADEEAIRPLLIAAQEAEAEAKIAVIRARNARNVTQQALQSAVQKGLAQTKAAKQAARRDRSLERREAGAAASRIRSQAELDQSITYDHRISDVASDEAAAIAKRSNAERNRKSADVAAQETVRKSAIEQANRNAVQNVDPLETFRQTGEFALQIDTMPIVVRGHGIKTEEGFLKAMRRIEDDLLGPNRDKPERWSPITRQISDYIGPENVRRDIMRGEYTGWSTQGERDMVRNVKQGGAVAGAGAAAAGGYVAVDSALKERQRKRVARLVEDPEFVKVLQRALRRAEEYRGTAHGRFNDKTEEALARFQIHRGIRTEPGAVTKATLDELDRFLVFEGREKDADKLREMARRGPPKPVREAGPETPLTPPPASAPAAGLLAPQRAPQSRYTPNEWFGMGDEERKEAQGMLNAALGTRIPVDGRWGPRTEEAVKAFQEGVGLPATGKMDQATVDALAALQAAQ